MKLEKIGQLFQVLSEYFEKNGYFIHPHRNYFIFSFQYSESKFMLEKRFLVKYLSRRFDQHTAKIFLTVSL